MSRLGRRQCFKPIIKRALASGQVNSLVVSVSASSAQAMQRSTLHTAPASASSASTATRSAGKSAAVSAGAAISLLASKSFTRTVAVAAASASTVARALSRTALATAASVTSLARAVGKSLSPSFGAAQASSLLLGRGLTLSLSVSRTATLTAIRAVGTTLTLSASASTTLARSIGKTASVGVGRALSFLRSIGKFFQPSIAGTSTLDATPVISGALTAGTLSATPHATTVDLAVTQATGGTPPYTYEFQRSHVGPPPTFPTIWDPLQTGSSLTYTDTGLTVGATYHYRVLVSDAVSGSALSNVVDVTTSLVLPTIFLSGKIQRNVALSADAGANS